MQSIQYEDLPIERLRSEIIGSSIHSRDRNIVAFNDKEALILELRFYDDIIMKSDYIYGNHNDIKRICRLRGLDINGISEEKMRATLRNDKNDSEYSFIQHYISWMRPKDVIPEVLSNKLDYNNYDSGLLVQYFESSELRKPEDQWMCTKDICDHLEKYDKLIKDSGYRLGNRSDILRICENRRIGSKHSNDIHLRDMLRRYDDLHPEDSPIISKEFYWNLNVPTLREYLKESELYDNKYPSIRKGDFISRLVAYDAQIKDSGYSLGNEQDIIRICKSRSIKIDGDVDHMRRILRDRDAVEYSCGGSDEKDADYDEKTSLLKKKQ